MTRTLTPPAAEVERVLAQYPTGLVEPIPTAPAEPAPTRTGSLRVCCPAPPLGPTITGAITRPNGEMYHPRSIGDHTDVHALRCAHTNKIPYLLYGPPGTGKTSLFEAAAAETGFEMIAGSADTEVADFVGSWVPCPDGGYRWENGPLVRAMLNGIPFLVDEIALISPGVLPVLYPLLDGRNRIVLTQHESEEIIAAEGFAIAGAYNPYVPGANLSEALLSRFTLRVEVGTDWDLARSLGVPAKVIKVAKNLDRRLTNNEVTWAPQLRELLGYVKIREALGDSIALENLVAQAPDEDRPIVAEVVSNVFGAPVAPVKVGAQI